MVDVFAMLCITALYLAHEFAATTFVPPELDRDE